MKKVLIVGGCGFIGHNLAIKLSSYGHDITVVDSFAVNNLITLINNQDDLPYPELSKKILEERIKLIKNNVGLLIKQYLFFSYSCLQVFGKHQILLAQ